MKVKATCEDQHSLKPPSSENQKKKRKLQADGKEAGGAAVVTDADPEITLRVACLDGSSLDLKVPPRELVREVKRAIGQVRRRRVAVLRLQSRRMGFNLLMVFVNGPPTRPFPTC